MLGSLPAERCSTVTRYGHVCYARSINGPHLFSRCLDLKKPPHGHEQLQRYLRVPRLVGPKIVQSADHSSKATQQG